MTSSLCPKVGVSVVLPRTGISTTFEGSWCHLGEREDTEVLNPVSKNLLVSEFSKMDEQESRVEFRVILLQSELTTVAATSRCTVHCS